MRSLDGLANVVIGLAADHTPHDREIKPARGQKSHLLQTLGTISGGVTPETSLPQALRTLKFTGLKRRQNLRHSVVIELMTFEFLTDTCTAESFSPSVHHRLGKALLGKKSPGLKLIEQGLEGFGRGCVRRKLLLQLKPAVLSPRKIPQRPRLK
jgi:hypothetical protein